MARKQAGAGQAPPPGADDLTMIKGIGPAHAQQLYAAGITSFAQLESLSAEEIAAQLGGPAARAVAHIRSERWVEQARALAERTAGAPAVEGTPGALGERPGHEAGAAGTRGQPPIIVITLTLNPDSTVADTRVNYPDPERGYKHVSWPGWDERLLLHQLGRHARLTPAADPAPPQAGEQPKGAGAAAGDPAPPGPRLLRMALVQPPAGAPQGFVSRGEPCQFALELDLAELLAAGARPAHYALTLRAHRLGSGRRQVAGEARGALGGRATVSITAPARTPPPGLYRIEADLELEAAPGESPYHGAFTLPGELVYIS